MNDKLDGALTKQSPEAAIDETLGWDPESTEIAQTLAAIPAPADRLPRLSLGSDTAELELIEEIGRGGMGVVYSARQHSMGREVAIKQANDQRPLAATALIYEATVTGGLEHPNIVPVHQIGRDPAGRPIIVMKRVTGVTWSELLSDPEHPHWETLPEDRLQWSLEVLIQVCNAVDFAHAHGVIHRDIKPENVMLGDYGEVYVMDWGIATRMDAPQIDAIVGTPVYMAPEMAGREPVDARTDVYLLGATLHEILTGKPRHAGESVYAVLLHVAQSLPIEYPEVVPEELAQIANRATARDPDDRFDSARALREAIESHLQHRYSLTLTHRALSRLHELEELTQEEDADLHVMRACFAECRFGFRSALEPWPENSTARDGWRRALACMFEAEVARDHLEAAEALLADGYASGPAWDERRTRLIEQLNDRAYTRARLEEQAHAADLNISTQTRARFTLTAGLLVTGVVVVLATLLNTGILQHDALTAAFTNLTVWLGFLTVLPWLLRKVQHNAANLRLIAALYLVVTFTVVLRFSGWHLGVDIFDIMRFEGLAVTYGFILLGILAEPRVRRASAITTVMTLGLMFTPDRWVLELLMLIELGPLLWIGWVWLKAEPSADAKEAL